MAGLVEIRRADWAEIVDLRHEILRAGLPRSEAIFPGDELSSSRHYGAFVTLAVQDGSAPRTVGCATFHASQWQGEPAWQLRGMASALDYRGTGLGRRLLSRADEDVLADPNASRLLWCNARVPAVGFYRLLGWDVVSDVFEIPTAGPHVKMVRRIGERS